MPRRSPALVLVHAVWATCHRRPVLPPTFDDTLAGILGAKARDLGCALLVAGCADDHVHTVLRLAAAVRLADLMQHIKGGSAYDANRHPLLSQRLVWQAGYWAESLSPERTAPGAPAGPSRPGWGAAETAGVDRRESRGTPDHYASPPVTRASTNKRDHMVTRGITHRH